MRNIFLLSTIALMLLVIPAALAQDDEGTVITDDEVNAVAKELYCPVCENIPLDTCGTAACQDWRDEIRLFLEAGMTEAEIKTDFVNRFGDRVVGTPQDPFLRAISLVTPWLLALAAVGIGGYTLFSWQQTRLLTDETAYAGDGDDQSDIYRDLLEQDLSS